MVHPIPHRPAETRAPMAVAEDNEKDQTAEAEQHIAWFVTEAKAIEPTSYRYVLLLRFIVVNLVAFSLLGVAYAYGLVDLVFASDRTNLSAAIFVIFLCGLAICAWRVGQTSRDINQLKDFSPLIASRASAYLAELRGRNATSRATYASALRLKLSNRILIVRNIASSLVLLGLVGTVIGFIIALSGISPDNVSQIDAIAPMVSKLIEGMSVALYTTLVGAVLNLWLMVNHHLLATGTVKLITGLVEFGESRARA